MTMAIVLGGKLNSLRTKNAAFVLDPLVDRVPSTSHSRSFRTRRSETVSAAYSA